MKRLLTPLLLVLTITAVAQVPYTITLERLEIDGMPGLHSFAMAEMHGQIILIGGRTNGMHGFPQGKDVGKGPSFPRSQANDTIYLIDLIGGRLVGSKKVTALAGALRGQLSATNGQSIQDGHWLYILGGYGTSPDATTLITLPQVCAVDVPALQSLLANDHAVLNDITAKRVFGTVPSLAAKVTGGGLEKLGDKFLLVFGQLFDGEYTANSAGFLQTYTNAIRVLNLSAAHGSTGIGVTASLVGTNPADPNDQSPDGPYHRRDLTVRAAFTPSGTPVVAAYGGVFKGGNFEGYLHPMLASIDSGSPAGIKLEEDTTTTQLLSQYHCATLQVYDRSGRVMYSTFLGGISQYWWDPVARKLVQDPVNIPRTDGLPFINSVSTLVVAGRGSGQYLHEDLVFPPPDAAPSCGEDKVVFLGSETHFVPSPGVPAFNNGVLDLNGIARRGRQMIGWLVGGIATIHPNGQPTCASDAVYKVYLDPAQPSRTVKLQQP